MLAVPQSDKQKRSGGIQVVNTPPMARFTQTRGLGKYYAGYKVWK